MFFAVSLVLSGYMLSLPANDGNVECSAEDATEEPFSLGADPAQDGADDPEITFVRQSSVD